MKLDRRLKSEAGYILTNPTDEELTEIKRALTFKNPKYEQVKRFSRWATTRIPEYLMLYRLWRHKIEGTTLHETRLYVPYGFQLFNFLRESVRVAFSSPRYEELGVSLPRFLLIPRQDQRKALKAYMRENQYDSSHAGLVVMPTGKGKSILGMMIAARLKLRTLIVVHKNDLIVGWKKDAKLCFGSVFELGQIQQKKRDVREITIATVQTLARMEQTGELEDYLDRFGLVILDECHHAPSTTFSLVDKFHARYRLGLTATLERKDGLAFLIDLYFGRVCYRYEADEGAEDKDILPVEVFTRDISFHYDPIFEVENVPAQFDQYGRLRQLPYLYCILSERFPKEDYELAENESYLSNLSGEKKKMEDFSYADIDTDSVMCEEVQAKVIEDLRKEYHQGHSCVLFFTQKEHLRQYAALIKDALSLNESSIGLYYGDSSNDENERVLNEAAKRNILITLTTYKKAGEGTNCKAWEVGFLISSVADGKTVEQAAGRIRRSDEGKLPCARLYDYNYIDVQGLKAQYKNRRKRYLKLGFTIHEKGVEQNKIFSKGFHIFRGK